MDVWNRMKSLFYPRLVHSNCPVCGFLKSRIFMLIALRTILKFVTFLISCLLTFCVGGGTKCEYHFTVSCVLMFLCVI